MSDQSADPAYTTQPPPETVELWLFRIRNERAVAEMRLQALDATRRALQKTISVYEARIKVFEDMLRPNLWADAVEAQLHVPPAKDQP